MGRHWAEDHWRALRWSSGTTEFLPASPEGHRHAEAVAIAPSGDVILGCAFNTHSTVSGRQRYMDSASITDARPLIFSHDGVQVLPGLEAGYNWWPFDISDDGQVIVGLRWPLGEHFHDSIERSSGLAFRWENGQATLLGTLPGCQHSQALTISGDGQTIAGLCFYREQQNTHAMAFVWDAEHGMRSVADVLSQAGANPGGWLLQRGKSLSHDGLSLVGQGKNPQGRSDAWFARLPSE